MIAAESSGNPRAVSRDPKTGAPIAYGLMQLIPSTARSEGVTNSLDPTQNVVGGSRYLRSLVDRYSGNLARALAAYNEGPALADRGVYVPETRAYVNGIIGRLLRGAN